MDNQQTSTQNEQQNATSASASIAADAGRRRSVGVSIVVKLTKSNFLQSVERYQGFMKMKADNAHKTDGHDLQHVHDVKTSKPGVLGNLWSTQVTSVCGDVLC
jgi:hypothetical protein